jgi:hypothetical protein
MANGKDRDDARNRTHGETSRLCKAEPLVTLFRSLAFLFCFVAAGLTTSARAQEQRGNNLPTVEVSLVRVEPRQISAGVPRGESAAIVTVQLAHTPLVTEQTVAVNVGNYSTEPAEGVVVTYDPTSRIVHLPPSPSGVVVTTFKIMKAEIGSAANAKVVIWASATNPSSGVRVINSDPGLPNHQAVIAIERARQQSWNRQCPAVRVVLASRIVWPERCRTVRRIAIQTSRISRLCAPRATGIGA